MDNIVYTCSWEKKSSLNRLLPAGNAIKTGLWLAAWLLENTKQTN
jgi:hypothetical protein